MRLLRLLRTVRHLRPIQILGRIRFRLTRPRIIAGSWPSERAAVGQWIEPVKREPSLRDGTCFRFLNVEHDLNIIGWDDLRVPKLWRYNLHYFDDLTAAKHRSREQSHHELVGRWIRENPVGVGTAWEPYPISLRVVNWIKWFLGGASVRRDYLESLTMQVRWLTKRLEFHLLGNHLFVNAKALVFAGLFFEGAEADAWFEQGLRILEKEIPEQLLADGGHFERAPMYHALATEDVLDLLNVSRSYARDLDLLRLCERVPSMLDWLRCMTHPDRTLANFNDTAQEIAPTLSQLEKYAGALGVAFTAKDGEGITHLRDSGYVRMSRAGITLIFDAAPIGPDYIPGHAHADTLSLELSLGKQRLIVNGGTSIYAAGEQRSKERSTAQHSTVQIEDLDSSEVWSAFRVGRRAKPRDFALESREWKVSCSHDGYTYLRGAPIHRRVLHLSEDAYLTVEDTITVPDYLAVARYLLAPGLRADLIGGREVVIRAGAQVLARVEALCGKFSIGSATYAHRFGEIVGVETVVVSLVSGRALTRWTLNSNQDAHPIPH